VFMARYWPQCHATHHIRHRRNRPQQTADVKR